MTKWKSTQINWQALEDFDTIEQNTVCLNQKQIAVLKALLSPAYWQTRWTNQTDDWDTIENFVATIDAQLDGQECDVIVDCDDVAACIGSSEAVTDALTEFNTVNNGTGGVGNPETILPEETRTADLLPPDMVCDNDHRYAMALGIVDAIHGATQEVFQAIELVTNPAEIAAALGDNVPIVGAAAGALEIANWIQDSAFEAYSAAWSDVVRDQISCELFCLMQEEYPCYLDYDTIFGVYKDVSFPSPPSLLDNWLTWAEWIIGLPFSTDVLTVKVCGLMGLSVLRFGGAFGNLGLGVRSLQMVMSLLVNDTNPDWAILCHFYSPPSVCGTPGKMSPDRN